MPIFDFQCQDCGAESEIFVRGGQAPVCGQCQSKRVEKLMSAPAGHVAGGTRSLPVMGSSCPPSDAPPCSPRCCRLPQ
ncbi:FmdB family zinc ribbon protein [Planctomicrobium piriforme]|uniref:Putative regulatory protein, FmdB family n=1 Tax=Planctomicrobium piriforme TaxID=1576369 RepID=A0A1I3FFZ9_9PLAN|nr:putative regulatory protein, FmdB family [Planctomicrobium piriforme]